MEAREMENSTDRVVFWCSVLVVLNFVDIMMTTLALSSGAGFEVNPLMRVLWNLSPVVFASTKIAVVALGAHIFTKFYWHAFANYALYGSVAMYGIVCTYHVYGVTTL